MDEQRNVCRVLMALKDAGGDQAGHWHRRTGPAARRGQKTIVVCHHAYWERPGIDRNHRNAWQCPGGFFPRESQKLCSAGDRQESAVKQDPALERAGEAFLIDGNDVMDSPARVACIYGTIDDGRKDQDAAAAEGMKRTAGATEIEVTLVTQVEWETGLELR